MKARLQVPLLTAASYQQHAAFLASPLPALDALWVYNVSHARVASMADAKPQAALLALFSNRSQLPSPDLVDVPQKRGTWQFFVQKTAATLALELTSPRCTARKSFSLIEKTALVAILVRVSSCYVTLFMN